MWSIHTTQFLIFRIGFLALVPDYPSGMQIHLMIWWQTNTRSSTTWTKPNHSGAWQICEVLYFNNVRLQVFSARHIWSAKKYSSVPAFSTLHRVSWTMDIILLYFCRGFILSFGSIHVIFVSLFLGFYSLGESYYWPGTWEIFKTGILLGTKQITLFATTFPAYRNEKHPVWQILNVIYCIEGLSEFSTQSAEWGAVGFVWGDNLCLLRGYLYLLYP